MTAITLTRLSGASPELRSALESANLPVDDLSESGRTFFRADEFGETVGFGGYELHGSDALLRSVVVLQPRRHAGAGRRLAEAVLAEARQEGARAAYLFTTTASAFFERLGFVALDRADAPAAIMATREASMLCPSTAALLSRSLEVSTDG